MLGICMAIKLPVVLTLNINNVILEEVTLGFRRAYNQSSQAKGINLIHLTTHDAVHSASQVAHKMGHAYHFQQGPSRT